MKRKILSITAAIVMIFTAGFMNSCTDYQDDYDAMNSRLSALEDLVNMANKDIADVHTIVDALEQGDYITSVKEVDNGYKITFKKYGEITITNGENGTDGVAPQLSIVKADPLGTGVESFYWALNGVLIQVDGQYVEAVGKDGESAPTPRLDIQGGKWYYTFDPESDPNAQWVEMGPAVGVDGKDAQPLEMIFRKVELTEYTVIFTLNQKDPTTNEYISFEVPLFFEEFAELFTYKSKPEMTYDNNAVMYYTQKVLIDGPKFGFDSLDVVKVEVLSITDEFVTRVKSDKEIVLSLNYPKDGKNDGKVVIKATKTDAQGKQEVRQLDIFAGSPVMLINQYFLRSGQALDDLPFRGSLFNVKPHVSASEEPSYLDCAELPKGLVDVEYTIRCGDYNYDETTDRLVFVDSPDDSKWVKENARSEWKNGFLFIDIDQINQNVSERCYILEVTVSFKYATEKKESFAFFVDLYRPV